MNNRKLEQHFKKWHAEYDDAGRVVNVDDYRRIVHIEDHAEATYLANHVHVLGFTIPVKEKRRGTK